MNKINGRNMLERQIKRGFLTVLRPLEAKVEQTLSFKRNIFPPGHRQLVVIGGGQSGTVMLNRLTGVTGLEPSLAAVIDSQSGCYIREGLELFPYDIMELEDIKRPILGRLPDKTLMYFEEVIHMDPKNHFIGTFDGSEITYDYCVIANSLTPDFAAVKNLEEALGEKYTFIVSTHNIEAATKMKNRLESFYGKDILVYSSGLTGLDFTRGVNHALLLKSKFPKANVTLIVNASSICPDLQAHTLLKQGLTDKNIKIVLDTKLEGISSATSAVFSNSNLGTREESFDLLYVEPPYREPKHLTDAGIFRKDFCPTSFEHSKFGSLFAAGSYITYSNTLAGLLEQTFSGSVNIMLQLLCDNNLHQLRFNRKLHYDGYQLHNIFPTQSSMQKLQIDPKEQNINFSSASRLDFYQLGMLRYNKFYSRTLKGLDFGRLGYLMPVIEKCKVRVETYDRQSSFL